MEEFERNRRIYIGHHADATEKTRRQCYAALRRFVHFCATEAQPRARRIREIKQDHYAQFMDSPQMRAKSAATRYNEGLLIATFAATAKLNIVVNTVKLCATMKNSKANS
jgi:hypothetical protein